MCFAILRVKFKDGSAPVTVDAASEEAADTLVAQYREQAGVLSIKVFQISHGIERQEQWVATNG